MADASVRAAVAELVTQLHTNIDSIHATLADISSTSHAHHAELERLSQEREQKIVDLRETHFIALKDLVAQREKDGAGLVEQRRREREELELKRQKELEELLLRRKQEDEEREKALQEMDFEKNRTIQEEDSKREAEREDIERSLHENVERELERLEDEMEKKFEEGKKKLRELDENRKAINAQIDSALDIPSVIPPIVFRSRSKTLKDRLSYHQEQYGMLSPAQESPVFDRRTSDVDDVAHGHEQPKSNGNLPLRLSVILDGRRDSLVVEKAEPDHVPAVSNVEDAPRSPTADILHHIDTSDETSTLSAKNDFAETREPMPEINEPEPLNTIGSENNPSDTTIEPIEDIVSSKELDVSDEAAHYEVHDSPEVETESPKDIPRDHQDDIQQDKNVHNGHDHAEIKEPSLLHVEPQNPQEEASTDNNNKEASNLTQNEPISDIAHTEELETAPSLPQLDVDREIAPTHKDGHDVLDEEAMAFEPRDLDQVQEKSAPRDLDIAQTHDQEVQEAGSLDKEGEDFEPRDLDQLPGKSGPGDLDATVRHGDRGTLGEKEVDLEPRDLIANVELAIPESQDDAPLSALLETRGLDSTMAHTAEAEVVVAVSVVDDAHLAYIAKTLGKSPDELINSDHEGKSPTMEHQDTESKLAGTGEILVLTEIPDEAEVLVVNSIVSHATALDQMCEKPALEEEEYIVLEPRDLDAASNYKEAVPQSSEIIHEQDGQGEQDGKDDDIVLEPRDLDALARIEDAEINLDAASDHGHNEVLSSELHHDKAEGETTQLEPRDLDALAKAEHNESSSPEPNHEDENIAPEPRDLDISANPEHITNSSSESGHKEDDHIVSEPRDLESATSLEHTEQPSLEDKHEKDGDVPLEPRDLDAVDNQSENVEEASPVHTQHPSTDIAHGKDDETSSEDNSEPQTYDSEEGNSEVTEQPNLEIMSEEKYDDVIPEPRDLDVQEADSEHTTQPILESTSHDEDNHIAPEPRNLDNLEASPERTPHAQEDLNIDQDQDLLPSEMEATHHKDHAPHDSADQTISKVETATNDQSEGDSVHMVHVDDSDAILPESEDKSLVGPDALGDENPILVTSLPASVVAALELTPLNLEHKSLEEDKGYESGEYTPREVIEAHKSSVDKHLDKLDQLMTGVDDDKSIDGHDFAAEERFAKAEEDRPEDTLENVASHSENDSGNQEHINTMKELEQPESAQHDDSNGLIHEHKDVSDKDDIKEHAQNDSLSSSLDKETSDGASEVVEENHAAHEDQRSLPAVAEERQEEDDHVHKDPHSNEPKKIEDHSKEGYLSLEQKGEDESEGEFATRAVAPQAEDEGKLDVGQEGSRNDDIPHQHSDHEKYAYAVPQLSESVSTPKSEQEESTNSEAPHQDHDQEDSELPHISEPTSENEPSHDIASEEPIGDELSRSSTNDSSSTAGNTASRPAAHIQRFYSFADEALFTGQQEGLESDEFPIQGDSLSSKEDLSPNEATSRLATISPAMFRRVTQDSANDSPSDDGFESALSDGGLPSPAERITPEERATEEKEDSPRNLGDSAGSHDLAEESSKSDESATPYLHTEESADYAVVDDRSAQSVRKESIGKAITAAEAIHNPHGSHFDLTNTEHDIPLDDVVGGSPIAATEINDDLAEDTRTNIDHHETHVQQAAAPTHENVDSSSKARSLDQSSEDIVRDKPLSTVDTSSSDRTILEASPTEVIDFDSLDTHEDAEGVRLSAANSREPLAIRAISRDAGANVDGNAGMVTGKDEEPGLKEAKSIDAFQLLEPGDKETQEIEAGDIMDEGSLKDGAPLNGSTGPSDHSAGRENIITPDAHRTVVESGVNRFAQAPINVPQTDSESEYTDSEISGTSEEDESEGEEDSEDEESGGDNESYGSNEEDEVEISVVSAPPTVPHRVERSSPRVIHGMPSYEFGKPKMLDPFSETTNEQIDTSSSISSGLYSSLVDTIKSDSTTKQMGNRSPRQEDEYSAPPTPTKTNQITSHQTDTEDNAPIQDTFSDQHATNTHSRSLTADSVPFFESNDQSDAESTASETPSSPAEESVRDEPQIATSTPPRPVHERRGSKVDFSPLRAEFDPYGTNTYPKYITPKQSQANLKSPVPSPRSPRNERTMLPLGPPLVPHVIISQSPNRARGTTSPTSMRYAQSHPKLPERPDGPITRPSYQGASLPKSPTAERQPVQAPAVPPPPPPISTNSFFQRTRSLFERAPVVAAPVPEPKLQKKDSTIPRSRPSSIYQSEAAAIVEEEGEEAFTPRSLDGNGKPPSPIGARVARSGSVGSQRSGGSGKGRNGSLGRVENDINVFVPGKDIRARSDNAGVREREREGDDRDRGGESVPLLEGEGGGVEVGR